MKTYEYALRAGITRTMEFERKGLASFAVNIGLKCDHDCTYCSSGTMLRMHRGFRELGVSPFSHGCAIIDPTAPARIARDARRMRQRGLVQLCTTTDAWSPAAQRIRLGRNCLAALLAEPGWSVRILTKSAAVAADYDLIEQFRDRVLVGLSITAPPARSALAAVIEPHASPISERIEAIRAARDRGLRVYGMLCPLLPGIGSDPSAVEDLVGFVSSAGAEELFVEPVNGRGPALRNTETALQGAGFLAEAAAIARIRQAANWSRYAADLVATMQAAVRRHYDLARLRFLLYPARLLPEDVVRIRRDDVGVIWLGRTETQDASAGDEQGHSTLPAMQPGADSGG